MMLATLLLLQAVATPNAAALLPSLTPPSPADIVPTVPLAERVHGAHVADRAGHALGVIDSSDASLVVVVVGTRKVQMPAAALRRMGGVLTLPITAQQIEQTLAASAAYQAQTHPIPAPVAPPNGFVPLKPIAATQAASR